MILKIIVSFGKTMLFSSYSLIITAFVVYKIWEWYLPELGNPNMMQSFGVTMFLTLTTHQQYPLKFKIKDKQSRWYFHTVNTIATAFILFVVYIIKLLIGTI